VDRAGNLYIADFNAHRVYRLSSDGTLTAVAGTGAPGYSGDGGLGVKAQLAFPAGLAIDNQGALYISDTQNRVIRRVAASGTISTYAQGITATGLAFDPAGRLYAADPVGGGW
jgi:sugar lactone lactonase YvrE